MRIALISDIHGNTAALRAVLDDIMNHDVDTTVCLGDIAATGPDPSGAVDIIADLGGLVVRGNTDEDMLAVPKWWHDPAAVGAPASAIPIAEIGVWCASQLSAEQQEFLDELPLTTEVDLGEAGALLAFHGSPRLVNDNIIASTPVPDVAEMLQGTTQSLLAGGHTHVPMLRRHGSQTIVNPGSVGAPFAGYSNAGDDDIASHAAYALITTHGSAMDIDLRQVPVSRDDLETMVQASGMPQGEWWLDRRTGT
jgi:predicted phosphodiesterase